MSLTIKLPDFINSSDAAKKYLRMLFDNGYCYHPDDSAFGIDWSATPDEQPTPYECAKMDHLMAQCCEFGFEPFDDIYDYIMCFDPEYYKHTRQ